MNLRIDPEFRDKIPPMSADEFAGLENDILRDGYVREKLVVWKEENILLDGHNRWKIIQEHLDVLDGKYEVDYKSFSNRYECIAWICANQLHRHNMNDFQKSKLLQEEYEARQKSITNATGVNQYTKVDGGKNLHQPKSLIDNTPIEIKHGPKDAKTRQIIAKEHNITEGAIKSAVEFGRGVDKGEEVLPGFKKEVLSGNVNVSKKKISELRKMEPEERKEEVEKILAGESKKKYGERSAASPPHGYKKQMEFLQQNNERKRDGDTEDHFSIQTLAENIRLNGESYLSSLRNQLTVRSTLLVGENRKIIENEIEKIHKEILKIKELLK